MKVRGLHLVSVVGEGSSALSEWEEVSLITTEATGSATGPTNFLPNYVAIDGMVLSMGVLIGLKSEAFFRGIVVSYMRTRLTREQSTHLYRPSIPLPIANR